MREIKFRAWTGTDLIYIKPGEDLQLNFGINDGWALWEPYGELCDHKEGELMQYTGLKDKNGIEIYEGDIVKQIYHAETGSYEDGISFDGHHIGQVVITARKGVCMRNPYCYSEETDETNISNQYKSVAGYRCEVIGNIYENPEKLETVCIVSTEIA